MTQQEIAARVKELNELIDSNFNPAQFVLNKNVMNALNEISDLQEICEHDFQEKKCIYCGKYMEDL